MTRGSFTRGTWNGNDSMPVFVLAAILATIGLLCFKLPEPKAMILYRWDCDWCLKHPNSYYCENVP